MGAFSLLRGVYDLDTLDTRFTNPSSTPYKTVIESRNDPGASKDGTATSKDKAQAPKWKTPEFIGYAIFLSFIIPSMFWVAYSASQPSNPQYNTFEKFLSAGWIPGRRIDVSDDQYHTFRSNMPYMAGLLLLHPLCRRLYNSVVYPVPVTSAGPSARPTLEEADGRLEQRASFDFGFALIFLVALHGVSAVKIVTILYVNYKLATRLPRRFVPPATWVFNVGMLFANELSDGFMFEDMAALLSDAESAKMWVGWGRWVDGFGGIMSRWHILFNITVLRLISFNMDHYWSHGRRSSSAIEKKQIDPASLSERDRITIPAQAKDFSFRNYVAYAIYAPLYLTGPILTFNDYISQVRYKSATIETGRTIRYAIRFLLSLLTMEVVLHFIYAQAISKGDPDWGKYSAAQLSLLSYFNLHFIWLKLLLPWRLFRLWALVDGVDAPENLIRCVSDNWSTLSFWRSWHRSYNRWLIRYVYVPLGGTSYRDVWSTVRSIFNYVLTFTFVALWHDIQLRLLIWGWLIVLFMLPEIAARALFPPARWEGRPTAYRMICCAGGVVNVFMMMSANLVGFAVGLDGLKSIWAGMFGHLSGFGFFVLACAALFVGVQVMFEIRAAELRKGISLKC